MIASPPSPQPKHCRACRPALTEKLGVRSWWNGQRPFRRRRPCAARTCLDEREDLRRRYRLDRASLIRDIRAARRSEREAVGHARRDSRSIVVRRRRRARRGGRRCASTVAAPARARRGLRAEIDVVEHERAQREHRLADLVALGDVAGALGGLDEVVHERVDAPRARRPEHSISARGRSLGSSMPARIASSMSWLMYATRSTMRTILPSSVSGSLRPVCVEDAVAHLPGQVEPRRRARAVDDASDCSLWRNPPPNRSRSARRAPPRRRGRTAGGRDRGRARSPRRDLRSAAARARRRARCRSSRACASCRVRKWSPSGSMKTCVLPFSRRNAFEWTIRSRSRWNGVRSRHSSSGGAARASVRANGERRQPLLLVLANARLEGVGNPSGELRHASSALDDDRDGAAVRAPGGAGDVRRPGRAEEDDHGCDLLGLGEPAERTTRADGREHLVARSCRSAPPAGRRGRPRRATPRSRSARASRRCSGSRPWRTGRRPAARARARPPSYRVVGHRRRRPLPGGRRDVHDRARRRARASPAGRRGSCGRSSSR